MAQISITVYIMCCLFLEGYKSFCDENSITDSSIKRPVGWTSPGCCTPENPCRMGEGGCQKDGDCLGGLTCGTNNCGNYLKNIGKSYNCCQKRQLLLIEISLEEKKNNQEWPIEIVKEVDYCGQCNCKILEKNFPHKFYSPPSSFFQHMDQVKHMDVRERIVVTIVVLVKEIVLEMQTAMVICHVEQIIVK